MTDNELDDYMMLRSQQMVTTMIDEVGIESTGQWIECMLLNMLRIVNLPSHEAIQYFNEMSKRYVLLQEMSDKRVLN